MFSENLHAPGCPICGTPIHIGCEHSVAEKEAENRDAVAKRNKERPARREFEVDETREERLTRLSVNIINRLGAAIDRVTPALMDQKMDRSARWNLFREALNEVWADNDAHVSKPRYSLAPLTEEFAKISMKIEPRGEGGDVTVAHNGAMELNLGLNKLLQAKTDAEFANARQRLCETVYHESEHLDFFGADLGDETPEDAVRYYSNPGEMRAHAKQFAFRYTTFFPNQPFSLEKIKSICTTNTEMNYFTIFALPDRREKYKHITDVLEVHKQIAGITATLVDHFNGLNEPESIHHVVAENESTEVMDVSELSKERLVRMNNLELAIEANFEPVLEALRAETGADLKSRAEGFHVSIVAPTEAKVLSTLSDTDIAELQEISREIQMGVGITVDGIGYIDGANSPLDEEKRPRRMRKADAGKKTAYLALSIPRLQAFRERLGLPPKDFHVTLGFENADVHMMVTGDEEFKPGKFKEVTAPIPKKANPKYNGLIELLPELKYSGLTGPDKQEKKKE